MGSLPLKQVHSNAVLAIIAGLEDVQLNMPVLPSGWTPIGLIRHLAGAEATWFQWVVNGTQPQVTSSTLKLWQFGVPEPYIDTPVLVHEVFSLTVYINAKQVAAP